MGTKREERMSTENPTVICLLKSLNHFAVLVCLQNEWMNESTEQTDDERLKIRSASALYVWISVIFFAITSL